MGSITQNVLNRATFPNPSWPTYSHTMQNREADMSEKNDKWPLEGVRVGECLLKACLCVYYNLKILP